MTSLTHKRLIELLDFNPATGGFVWKIALSNRVKVGDRAGVHHKVSGGRYISIDGEKFMAHRLAIFYVSGEIPENDVRPIDGNYDNCAIVNLKEVSRIELQHARGANKNNTSGYAGVSAAPHGRFQAKITWNNAQVSLGMNFETSEMASKVVLSAYAALKAATSNAEIAQILETLRLMKRQRAAWAGLHRCGMETGWVSFEDFASTVKDIPEHRYAMAPLDVTRKIGPGNYRWASEGHAKTSTAAGKVQYARDNRKANADHFRDRRFRKEYGISFAQYQQMLLEQNGVCAICEGPETKIGNGTVRLLSVDHDHSTDAVRGLLCANCNMAIGYARDDAVVLEKAIRYLRKHAVPAAFICDNPNRDWLHVATPGFVN